MIRFRNVLAAVVIGSASFSLPAAAQYGEVSKSLTHVVSATIAPRVKTMVSTRQQNTLNGIGLSVSATQSWVLSIKAAASKAPADSRLHWSPSPKGAFMTLTSADTVLVAGGRSESPTDTAVFIRDVNETGDTNTDSTVFLTVSAP